MKKLFVLAFFVFFSASLAIAQVDENSSDEPRFYPEHHFSSFRYKPHIRLNTGASFGRWGNHSFYGTFLNPQVSQQISDRFVLSTGLFLTRTNVSSPESTGSEGSMPPLRNGNFNQAMVYGGGSYFVNDRLTINGDAFYGFNEQNPYFQQFNGKNTKGVSLGFDYKVSDKVRIGGGVRYMEGAHMGAFGNPMMMGPGMFGPPYINSFGNNLNNWW